jgi:hypothetical protein
MQLAVTGCCLILLAVLSVVTVVGLLRARRRYREDWMARARRLGFQTEGEFDHGPVLRHRVNGVEWRITKRTDVEYVEERRSRHIRRKEKIRAVIDALAPTGWSDAAIVRVAPDFFGVGTMREVPFEPWFGFRTFARDPGELSAWLTPSTRAAIVCGGIISSVSIQGGAVKMVLDAYPAEPSDVVTAMEIASAIHRGTAMAGPTPPIRPRRGKAYVPSLALLAGILGASIAGWTAPWTDDVASLLSPLACDEGELSIAGGTRHELRCGELPSTHSISLLGSSAIAAVCATPVLLATYLLVLGIGTAASARTEES